MTERILWISCELRKDKKTGKLVKVPIQGTCYLTLESLKKKLSKKNWRKQKRKLKKLTRRYQLAKR